MTMYTRHNRCPVACSILPGGTRRRRDPGSQKETPGGVIRSRCHAMRPGSLAGSHCFVSWSWTVRRSFGNVPAGGVKRSAMSGRVCVRKTSIQTKFTQNYTEIILFFPLVTIRTLISARNHVKRTCIGEISPENCGLHGKTPPKRITGRFLVCEFRTGGVCFNNLQVSPFQSRRASV